MSITRALPIVPIASIAVILHVHSVAALNAAEPTAKSILDNKCLACHEGESAEAGLDLSTLSRDLSSQANVDTWIRVLDRVEEGEMPPPDEVELSDEHREAFVRSVGNWISDHQRNEYVKRGRVRGRRLTNLQLERSLQDVLGIDIPLATRMPEEQRTGGFSTIASGQAMSHFQLEQHLKVVDVALDEAFARLHRPASREERDTAPQMLSAKRVSRANPKRRTREPELIDGHAVTWNGGPIFYGRIPATTARQDGWYTFTIRVKALNKPKDHGVWCTIRSGPCVSGAPMLSWLGAFEATDKTREITVDGWLPKGHMLEIRPGDATMKRASFRGGQVGTGEGAPQNVSGVAIESIIMGRFYRNGNDQRVRKLLLDELKLKPAASKNSLSTVVSDKPKADLTRLLGRFARRAFRRPVAGAEIGPYVEIALQVFERDGNFSDALRAGYRAILCSPRFLYFYETPGELDDHALACRMSYLLWNRPPDWPLRAAANEGKLKDPAVYREQLVRMLRRPQSRDFIVDFSSQWLDLSLIDFTEPDRRLYPGFDIIVQQSMLAETHAYLTSMLKNNTTVAALIQSEHTFLNNRLARHYGIKGVAGDEMRRFPLKPADHRGGLLTHGAIMKVTANGTTTSPVIRGVWVSERLLGVEAPPPPENVPAIEPDIRGAKSIRDQLAKHKSDQACAVCHTKIDPPGFALENFDPAGRWRNVYGGNGRRKKSKNKKSLLVIDASYDLADGRPFKDLKEFQSLIASEPEALATNLAEKLIAYGTGSPVTYVDRPIVDAIVKQTEKDDYGFRSVLFAVMESALFRHK